MALSANARAAVVAVAALIGVVLMLSLGAWQMRRAAQKTALQLAFDTRAALPPLDARDLAATPESAAAQFHRPVRLRGRWQAAQGVYLENRQMDARVGFVLVMPLLLEDRPLAVLVQRGFVPRDLRDRTLLPSVATPSGPVEIEGRIAPPPARLYEFAASASGPIRQNLDLAAFARETGLPLATPLSVLQTDAVTPAGAATGEGLRRHWPAPAVDVQKHHGYAAQWFALAALMAGLYAWFQIVRPRLHRRRPPDERR